MARPPADAHKRMTIANNIRRLRMRNFAGPGGAKRCADAIGCHLKAWYEWESGRRGLRKENLEKIATYFGVNAEDLSNPAQGESIRTPTRNFKATIPGICLTFAIRYDHMADDGSPLHIYHHPDLPWQTVLSIQAYGTYMREVFRSIVSAGFGVDILLSSANRKILLPWPVEMPFLKDTKHG